MGNRKIRIAFMVLITVAMFMGITLFANIGFATSDLMEPRLQGSSNAFDESLYFSAVQLYQRTNANGESLICGNGVEYTLFKTNVKSFNIT